MEAQWRRGEGVVKAPWRCGGVVFVRRTFYRRPMRNIRVLLCRQERLSKSRPLKGSNRVFFVMDQSTSYLCASVAYGTSTQVYRKTSQRAQGALQGCRFICLPIIPCTSQ